MALLNVFKTREIEEFAITLANDLARRFPTESESEPTPA